MAIITWKDCYATGIDTFDTEHKDLIERINSLYEAIRSKETETRLQEILPALISYTESHFNHEEELMQKHQFPELENHRQEHVALREKVTSFQERASQGDPQLPLQLFNFLREWLLHHIVEVDGQYGDFFRQKGEN